MSSRSDPVVITPDLLREWPVPAGARSKYDRGQIVVIGGARKSPGAALLAGTAALRVGAGRLTLGVAASVAVPLAVVLPESGVVGLAETTAGSVRGGGLEALAAELRAADAVVVGSGLDDAEEARALLSVLPGLLGSDTRLLLDAYALGALPGLGDGYHSAEELVLTPNPAEAAVLLGRELTAAPDGGPEDLCNDIAEIATRYAATVSCQGVIAAPDGQLWLAGTGQGGLATSGSGDVLAGAIAGLLARGAGPAQAACWGTYLHAAAGDRLNAGVGPTGYLARELVLELPALLAELGQRA